MKNKKKWVLWTFIILGAVLVSFFIYDQMKYTTFNDEMDIVRSEFNHDEEIIMVRIEQRKRDSETINVISINDGETISDISKILSNTKLKKNNPEFSSEDYYELVLSYPNNYPSTKISVYKNQILISEPSVHGSYRVTEDNDLYSYLKDKEFEWDERLNIND
ncbi:hypothetical protein [Alkalibacillus aidingensis]|uniref:hypothetical protein n=1 Tax=Alkalibacillus aidingensis TaxID=2747607 RepID=UPI0016615FAA|nr:hypothetical protein [Alkalibacillus aidingensis]